MPFFPVGPELRVFLEPLGLQEKQLIVLAVNNNQSVEYAGGSHWYVRQHAGSVCCVQIG